MICETDKHGKPHGAHLPLVGTEPGLASKRAENNLIVRQLETGHHRVTHPRGDMKKKKTGGGGVQIGGITVKNFAHPRSGRCPPNTPGSNTSTPMRILSSIAANRAAKNNRSRDVARSATSTGQRESLRGWMTPVTRPQNATLSRVQFPSLPVTRVTTVYESNGGGGRLIATQQTANTVALPSNFSMSEKMQSWHKMAKENK